MSRKTKMFTVPGTFADERGFRDCGKTFQITEMSAARGAEWATRVFLAVANTNVDLPPGVIGSGMEGVARMGLRALFSIPYERASPLLAELIGCVRRVEDPRHPFPRTLVIDPGNPDGDDVQEIATTFLLYGEVFELMSGFSVAAWIAESQAAARRETA